MNPRPSAPAATLLSNASRELRSLRILVERFEAAAYVLLKNSDIADCKEITDIQELDHLMQTINNIADFIEGISSKLPEDLSVQEAEALKSIKLEALANRLMNRSAEPVQAVDDEDNGDCSWF
ncbi:hypothetical protein [Hyphococcus sp.]|uniref:hypothetical protein n=1 Tax=Hyphococcus sp. TaxID=2038636 RepID=UPI003D12088D